MSEQPDAVVVGDNRLEIESGGVVVYNNTDDTEIGRISAAGLTDAARLDDDLLCTLGSMAYATEWWEESR